MAQKYKIRNTLKSLPFYSEDIKNQKQKNKKFSNIRLLSELPFFPKKCKKLTNKQLSEVLPFFPKRPKKLTKHQILKHILPLYDALGIPRNHYANKGCPETYNVEVEDRKSFTDSLFLAKRSIVD